MQVALLLELPDRSVGRNYFTRPILPPKFVSVRYGEIAGDMLKEKQLLADYVRFELPQGELIYAVAP